MKNNVFVSLVPFFLLSANLLVAQNGFRIGSYLGWQPNREFSIDKYHPLQAGLGLSYHFGTDWQSGVGWDMLVGIETGILRTQQNEFGDNPRGWSLGAEFAAGPRFGPVWVYGKLRYDYSQWRLQKTYNDCGCGSQQTVYLQQPVVGDPNWIFATGIEFRLGDHWRVGAEAGVNPLVANGVVAFDFTRPQYVRFRTAYQFGG